MVTLLSYEPPVLPCGDKISMTQESRKGAGVHIQVLSPSGSSLLNKVRVLSRPSLQMICDENTPCLAPYGSHTSAVGQEINYDVNEFMFSSHSEGMHKICFANHVYVHATTGVASPLYRATYPSLAFNSVASPGRCHADVEARPSRALVDSTSPVLTRLGRFAVRDVPFATNFSRIRREGRRVNLEVETDVVKDYSEVVKQGGKL